MLPALKSALQTVAYTFSMGNPTQAEFIIVGCGRVGTELALSLVRQNQIVTVVDSGPRAFEALGVEFRGRTVQGEAFDREVLRRAGIESAHGLAAVTNSDSINIVTTRVARDIFRVPHVVARIYNPRRAPIYERLGLPTVLPSAWGARRIEQILLHPGLQSISSLGNGEVQIYEITIPEEWEGRSLQELVPADHARTVGLARGGRGVLPAADIRLKAHDLLQVSATNEGIALLRERLPGHGNG